jgi:hypothetical protein
MKLVEKVAKSIFDLDTCMKLTRFVSCLNLASTCCELCVSRMNYVFLVWFRLKLVWTELISSNEQWIFLQLCEKIQSVRMNLHRNYVRKMIKDKIKKIRELLMNLLETKNHFCYRTKNWNYLREMIRDKIKCSVNCDESFRNKKNHFFYRMKLVNFISVEKNLKFCGELKRNCICGYCYLFWKF